MDFPTWNFSSQQKQFANCEDSIPHGAPCVFTQWPKCFGQSSCNFEGHGGQVGWHRSQTAKQVVLKLGFLDTSMWFQRLFLFATWGKLVWFENFSLFSKLGRKQQCNNQLGKTLESTQIKPCLGGLWSWIFEIVLCGHLAFQKTMFHWWHLGTIMVIHCSWKKSG